jgi:4-amino-4-deoxy-L-arabinose transferase-like glycosyltransferase
MFSYNRLFWQLFAVAVFALALRLAYQSGVASIHDSYGGAFSILSSGRASLYSFFHDAILSLINTGNLRVVVAVQALVDSLTVIAIALAARAFSQDLVIPAAITAAILPNFIVHASSILPETLFIAFFSWGLCSLLWGLRSRHEIAWLLIAGILFGFALLTRPVLMFFPFILLPVLTYALGTTGHSWRQCIAIAFIPPIAMIVVVSPLLIFDFAKFGYLELSSQTGMHLLYWVYGCLATPWPCADRGRLVVELTPLVAERIHTLGVDPHNAFAVSEVQRNLAIRLILDLPLWQIVWGMIWGAFKNLMQTSFYRVFTQYDQPLTFFSAMQGTTFFERLRNFALVNWGNFFMMMWILSQSCLVLSRVIQFYGVVRGLRVRHYRALTIILLVTILYFILINGPIADPKYRIPVEPPLIIFFALGVAPLIGWFSAKFGHRKSAPA